MTGGFSFCGTDIGRLGLYYVPELTDTFVYKPAEAQSHIETYEGHNGGFYYGSWYSPKEFTLRCYFEDSKIEKGIMAQIYALFKVGKSGKLVFDRRPWCYYYATVTDPIEDSFMNYENGIIIIHMKAMYPFARSDVFTNKRSEAFHDSMMANSAVFDKDGMANECTTTEYRNFTATRHIILANPGTERADLGISIAGNVGDGVIIINHTTGQACKFVGISKAVTTNVNKTVVLDPISGKTILTGAGEANLAFMFHEYGFISLEPSYPAIRDIYINSAGGAIISIANILNNDVIGKYICVKNKWYKITAQPDRHTLTIDGTIPSSGNERTMIISMNEIEIHPISTMAISSLKFLYKPTYA